MSDVKDDSIFVLKLTIIIGGFFMVFFSKIGYFLLILISTAGFCGIQSYIFNTPFWNQYVLTIILSTVIFEIVYPRFANFTKATHYGIKEEYDNAKNELKRRRTGINNEQ